MDEFPSSGAPQAGKNAKFAVNHYLRFCHQQRVRWCAAIIALFVFGLPQPSRAERVLSYEPLMMDPYSTIFVDDGSCSKGKVLKVQGAPRNQRRKKSCVPLSDVPGVHRPSFAK